ncbi:hypothetical protein ACFVRR_06920 [Gottfriedia sp. NPDC057948]|uniref:hypothetical protein n=1 Tax=Gottfriedia sp. NPDC057948 TaxID=3346287 RepID=UPI0036D7657F
MLGYVILGFVIFVIVMITYGFFIGKKFGPDIPNKSDHQTMNEEITRRIINNNNNNNIGPF